MMLGSGQREKSTIGKNARGLAPGSMARTRSASTSNRSGRPQHAHSLVTVTATGFFQSCPCTKGDATASTAQAPLSRSPVLKASACGVAATVTG